MNLNHLKLSWLKSMTIVGREEGDDPFERDDQGEILVEDDEQVLKDGWEFDDNGKPVKSDDSNDDLDDEANKDKKLEELQEALRKERQLRRKAERDAKRTARTKAKEKDTSDEAETKKQLEAATARTERLAEGLLKREINSAILEEARKQGFIDPTDALTDSIREAVDAEQDEDDPTDIDIDADSVADAVKELATKKKHLVGKGIPDEKSGGKFSKKGKGSGDAGDHTGLTHLQDTYPSLR